MNQLQISQENLTRIEEIAQQFNLSVNELLEHISQGELTVIESEELEDLIDLQDAIAAENDSENQERVSWELIKNNLLAK